MKRYLPLAIIIGVFALVVVSGALLFHFHRPPARSTSASPAAPGAQPPHVRGAASATVTLEEFGDYECPPCGNLSPILEKLEEDYAGRLRFVFRQFPFATHRHAMSAAGAAEAAGMQNRFWEMHDLLYRERFIWPRSADAEKLFAEYAARIGLDLDLFNNDRNSEAVKERIAADRQRGAALQVSRTPTLFLNDRFVPVTSLNPEGLRREIDALLKEKPR